jgi:serine phosphatase RsbU (regulator of sigma subunit)/tetratricopeptide (TPR) repeat protein
MKTFFLSLLLLLLSFSSMASDLADANELYMDGEYSKCITHYESSLFFTSSISDKADILQKIGISYYMIGIYDKAIDNTMSALEIYESLDDSIRIGNSLNNLGAFYEVQGKDKQALVFFNKSMELSKTLGDTLSVASSLNNIGCIKLNLGLTDEALEDLYSSLAINKKYDNKLSIIMNYRNIGNVYYTTKEYYSAIEMHETALELAEDISNDFSIMESCQNLGSDYVAIGDYNMSLSYSSKSLEMSKDLGSVYYESLICENLSYTHEKLGNYSKSLEFNKLHNSLKDSLESQKTKQYTTFLEIKYESSEKEKELITVKTDVNMKNLKLTKQKHTNTFLSIIVALILILGAIGFLFYRKNKIALKDRTIFSEELSEKNQEITDSMNYAKNIQSGILSTEEKFQENVPNSFVMFNPKDIVSGDFYWSSNEHKNKRYFAAVDCTGHGIPGAMISVIGHTALTRCINKGLEKPSDILNELNLKVSETFHADHKIKDGMDISLCSIDDNTNILSCAMGNNPVYIVRNIDGTKLNFKSKKFGNKILYKIPADRQYIGCGEDFEFVNHEIQLEQGDVVYLFSDGFADQFGGEKGKKYMYGKFQKKLCEVSDLKMDVQKSVLVEDFDKWKNTQEQIDDVLVIGVKIK